MNVVYSYYYLVQLILLMEDSGPFCPQHSVRSRCGRGARSEMRVATGQLFSATSAERDPGAATAFSSSEEASVSIFLGSLVPCTSAC
jgi:hypothetical protein